VLKLEGKILAFKLKIKIFSKILIADGSIVGICTEVLKDGIKVEVLNDAKLGERKNMNLPGCKIDLPTVTEKDEDDILNFGLKHGVDLIALSFTRRGADIECIYIYIYIYIKFELNNFRG